MAISTGETQASALADASNGRLQTETGDARTVATDEGVTVVGSVGVLVVAIDPGTIGDTPADEWSST